MVVRGGLEEDAGEEAPPAIAEKLRGAASVAVVKATDLRQGDNATEFGGLDRPWVGRVLRQRKVSTRPVVVTKIAVQPTAKDAAR